MHNIITTFVSSCGSENLRVKGHRWGLTSFSIEKIIYKKALGVSHTLAWAELNPTPVGGGGGGGEGGKR